MEVSKKILIVTVGSRGDIQPYVALASGLIKSGWKIGIATHGWTFALLIVTRVV